MSLYNELDRRWSPNYDRHSTAKAVKPHFAAVLNVLVEIDAKRSAANANKNLSDVGRADELRNFAPTLAPAMARARGAISGAKEALARQRANLAPVPKDRNDIASAILRSDVRRFNQGKPVAEIIRMAESDSTVMEAIFEGPAALSGLTVEVRDNILKSYLEKHAAPQLAAISEQQEAIALIETGIGAASSALADVAGIQPAAFDAWLLEKAPREARVAAEAFAPPTKSASTPDEFFEKLLSEGRAELAAIMAS
ncbi:hypothetical protein V5279_25220 [Bradyrhizobium sp. 26S5]|uniref:hypothetical protein n=1 Tax=Bradyrhizobium sp. 26S5 TaxID=3139729 RepID=UPI0030D0786C